MKQGHLYRSPDVRGGAVWIPIIIRLTTWPCPCFWQSWTKITTRGIAGLEPESLVILNWGERIYEKWTNHSCGELLRQTRDGITLSYHYIGRANEV